MITTLKDSGLRISDMVNLDVSDYTGAREVFNEAGEMFKVFEPVRVVKTQTIAYVHIGPESIKDIDIYNLRKGLNGTGQLLNISFLPKNEGLIISRRLQIQDPRQCYRGLSLPTAL